MNSKKSESGCKFGDKCSFAHRQVAGQSIKKPKKDGDKSAVAIFKDAKTLQFRISGQRAAGIFIDFTEEHESLGINSTSAIFTRATLRHANIRDNEGPSLNKNTSRRFLISAVPTL